MTSKKTIRKQLLTQRQNIAEEEWRQKSHAICTQLEQTHLVASARMILAYTSFRQEPDLMPLMLKLAQSSDTRLSNGSDLRDRVFGLPRCEGKSLIWHCWNPGRSTLNHGAYGILEPDAHWPVIDTQHLRSDDILLVPAVGCDRQGYRMGYGGGFYDRMLSDPAWASVTKIGIVFDFACVDRLPIDPWDQPLSGVCTENGLFL